jgi:hypothetical protein
MSKEQTAVEFLLAELDIAKIISREKLTMAALVVKQAKEMEKQQIMAAFNEGEINSVDYFNPENITTEEAEQYYNETFNK